MLGKLAVAATALALAVNAECPNACSHHGTCGSNDECVCYDGYVGGDCSQRVCPYGKAFVDSPGGDYNHDTKVGYGASVKSYSKAQAQTFMISESWPTLANKAGIYARRADGSIDPTGALTVGGWAAQAGEAHFLTECSGKGSCDRSTGACKCFDGYTGSACQRTQCPNDCSGHGKCRTLSDIATGALTANVESGSKGVTVAFDYNLWDADKIRACVCDAGYGGNDCSKRVCPTGDDPLTTQAYTCGNKPCRNAQQSFSVDGGQGNPTTPAGTYYLTFNTEGRALRTKEFALYTDSTVSDWTTKKALNEANIKAALESLPNNATGRVTVSSQKSEYGMGGANPRDQLRFTVNFETKTGKVAPMSLGWKGTSNAATKGYFVFPPGSPLQVISLTAGTPSGVTDKIQFKVFPLDQSQAGRPEYWTGPVVDIGYDLANLLDTNLGAAADKICDAFNKIPMVTLLYGKPCQRDATLLLSQVAGTGSDLIAKLALPDLNLGQNAVQFSQGKDASAMPAFGPAIRLQDVVQGTTEAVACSNRGICDDSTGQCQCFKGYFGLACQSQNVLAGSPGSIFSGSA